MAARPHARPVPGRRPPGEKLFSRLAARVAPRGMRAIADAQRAPAQLAGWRRHSLLVTFRRDGTPAPTPVWAAPSDGRLYVRTARASAKVARLRRDPRVLVAPCSVRGRPLGDPFEALARVLPPEREEVAERALRDAYGVGRALFEWWVDVLRADMCYLEISPGAR